MSNLKEQVITGLLEETAFRNRFRQPAALAERMAFCHTPGVSLAVVNNGEIEWAEGFGVREIGRPDPITPDTLFQAGSISKPIFALAVMRLVEQGRLELDEDVNNYLTSWRVPASNGWQPRLTLRHLLSHTAGLTVHGFPGYRHDEPVPAIPQLLAGEAPANTDPVEANILPGLTFRYSGGGTTVAQQAVVDVLGRPFPDIMRELIFEPLGLRNSTYEQPLPAARAAQAATAHPFKARPIPGRWHTYPEMAAAGLWTTPSDLARIGIEVQRALAGERGRLLSPETAAQMLTPQAETDNGNHIGIGFFMMGKGDAVRFGHGGWDEGFLAHLTLYRNGGKGMVLMMNANEGHPMIDEIERAVARVYEWPDYFPKDKTTVELPAASLNAYTGRFVTEDGKHTFTVHQDGGRLFLTLPRQSPLELLPESETAFYMTATNAEIAFMKDDSRVTALTVKQAGRDIQAKRKTEA
jgi:CubicO group peptidase (beta-lactamase class C family)